MLSGAAGTCLFFDSCVTKLSTLRTPVTYLMLVALLLSNAASWIHVGCCDSAPTGVHRLEAGTHLAQEESLKSEGRIAGRCSCHRHQCEPVVPAKPDSLPVESVPAHEHDSETCHLCQHYFASRNVVWGDAVVAVPVVEQSQRLGLVLDEVFIEPIYLSGLAVRGPPNA
jgi:hypothetical protein